MKIHLFLEFGPDLIADIDAESAPIFFDASVHGHDEEFVLDGADPSGLPLYEGRMGNYGRNKMPIDEKPM